MISFSYHCWISSLRMMSNDIIWPALGNDTIYHPVTMVCGFRVIVGRATEVYSYMYAINICTIHCCSGPYHCILFKYARCT
jgi:hypothetical protein